MGGESDWKGRCTLANASNHGNGVLRARGREGVDGKVMGVFRVHGSCSEVAGHAIEDLGEAARHNAIVVVVRVAGPATDDVALGPVKLRPKDCNVVLEIVEANGSRNAVGRRKLGSKTGHDIAKDSDVMIGETLGRGGEGRMSRGVSFDSGKANGEGRAQIGGKVGGEMKVGGHVCLTKLKELKLMPVDDTERHIIHK